ncbi:uncharacterized protein LOC128237006 isoform X2 [Mya arenaria]|uniref:uncharacterized protein LOC128237006 isoform X2 n=1 Tax=Mya arenaria TaxID=6604 RepID=UPI0022E03162|nr:uncharacterized protein LOC128237006 isoform X2 [Mya arenaria]
MWIMTAVVGLTILAAGKITAGESYDYPIYNTDSCDETGRKAVTCEEGLVLQIIDVRCMPHNFTCPEFGIISRLCDGVRSCSFLDLRRQLYTYCRKYPEKRVYTSFKCIPTNKQSACRANLCSEEAVDIRCRRGSIFHLLDLRCRTDRQGCPEDVFRTVHRVCETQRGCLVSVVINTLPRDTCNQHHNIFMEYICVDDSALSSKCVGEFIVQVPRFGILSNPGYPENLAGLSETCYWAIYPDTDLGEEIDLTIHEAYSLEGTHVCDTQYLQVQFTLCNSDSLTVQRFCEESALNVRIHSCGTVYVTHYPFPKGNDRGNRFLISYQVSSRASRLPAYDSFCTQCERPDAVLMAARYTKPYQDHQTTTATLVDYLKPTSKSSLTIPDEQPINDSSVSGGPTNITREVKGDEKHNRDRNDPWKQITLLRVVIVNIFIGLIIVALLMAIGYVCWRYVTYGRRKSQASKSETVTTLDETRSTEMRLLTEEERNKQQDPLIHNDGDGSESKTIKVATSPYETTIFHFNRHNAESEDETVIYDKSTCVSSFLPQPPLRRNNGNFQNTESAYSSFEEDQSDNGHYSDVIDTQCSYNGIMETPDMNMISETLSGKTFAQHEANHSAYTTKEPHTHEYQTNKPPSTSQSTGAEYAVLSKVPEQRKRNNLNQVDSHKSQTGEHDCVNVTTNTANHCAERHIQLVPEEGNHFALAETTMQLIPEHKCLLHNIPPPPPPPVTTRLQNLEKGINSWSTVQADV